MEDASNGGNRGPVVKWYEDPWGAWDIRRHDGNVEDQADGELANWLALNGGDNYYIQQSTMSIVYQINPELGLRVIEENRIFTKEEITGVMDDLAYGIVRKAKQVLELRKWCELELINLGVPCSVVIDKCRNTSRLAVIYVVAFWRLTNRLGKSPDDKYFWTQVLSDALVKFNNFMMSTDERIISSQTIIAAHALGFGNLGDKRFRELVNFLTANTPKPIILEHALGDALKLLDYIQAVFNERSKSIDESQPAPDLAKEKRLDAGVVKFAEMSKTRPVVTDNNFLILEALYELNQAVGVGFVKNKANELGGSFLTDNDVSKRCSILNKEFGFASTTQHKWSITEIGRSYVEVDLRFKTLNHSR